MPFTKDGITPDIIINPNAFPSRMTIGQFIECLLSKVSAVQGYESDGTPFSKLNVKEIQGLMKELGYEENGYEYLYNGMTGKKMKSMIFIGPTYYQRLKHMVADKIHCLDSSHDVLTFKGWKPIDKVTIEDKVATLKEGTLIYDNPTKVLKFPNYKGQMYSVESNDVDLHVTTNHRMWVAEKDDKYEFREAKEIVGKSVKYQKTANWITTNTQKFDLQSDLKTITESTNFPVHIWDYSMEQSRILINSLIEETTYCTVYEQQADDFMRLCLHAGWSGNKWQWGQWYSVKIVKENEIGKLKEKITEFEGSVYCLEVPSEIFYVRRHGKAVWTGNSRARGPKQMLTRRNKVASAKTKFFASVQIRTQHLQIAGITTRFLVPNYITKVYDGFGENSKVW